MNRFFRAVLAMMVLGMMFFPTLLSPVLAQSLGDILNLGNKPVNYDSPLQLGRGFKEADSIDSCMLHKEFNFNEIHNIWVSGMVRCKYNSKGVLSKATPQGVSSEPVDEQACANKRDGTIIVQGTPSEDEARRWSERCSYLGTIGGAGPVDTSSSLNQYSTGTSSTSGGAPRVATSTSSNRPSTASTAPATSTNPTDVTSQQASHAGGGTSPGTTTGTTTNYRPVYSGTGVQVPSEDLIPQGISRKKSLSELIIFYTNVTLPYVSVVAVFAFVASGIFYILSFANEELSGKAKTIMTYVVIGIVIIFSAYTVVNTLLSFVTFE